MLNTDTDIDVLNEITQILEAIGDGVYVLHKLCRDEDTYANQLQIWSVADWLSDAGTPEGTVDISDSNQFMRLCDAIKIRDGHVASKLVYSMSPHVTEAIQVQWRSHIES